MITHTQHCAEVFQDLRVLDNNPLYQNQTYRLRLKFNQKYPIGMMLTSLACASAFSGRNGGLTSSVPEPPEVIFVQEKSPVRMIPMHPHIYTK